jgi:hypothetical protein
MAVRFSASRVSRPLPPPPGIFLVLISVTGLVNPRATMRLEGLCQLQNSPMTSSGIELGTFRLMSQSTALPHALPKIVIERICHKYHKLFLTDEMVLHTLIV